MKKTRNTPPQWRLCLLLALIAAPLAAQGPPAARVTVAEIEAGRIAPTVDLEATVYFKEVAAVATEVSGLVIEVTFEEGQRLSEGDVMVRLDNTLLEPQLAENKALVAQALARLEQERVRFGRAQELLEDEITTPQELDDLRFTIQALDEQVAAAQARVQQIERELAKKVIRAPFDGVVIERNTELGEWKSPGATIAVFARNQIFDVLASVPESQLGFVEPGDELSVRIGDQHFDAPVVESAPRGDIASRTFPLRVRVTTDRGLVEGLSAILAVPSGLPTDCLMVPRDAVLLERGATTITTVEDGAARKVPVRVLGYSEGRAGVDAEGLTAGVQVITKGHERVRNGDPVEIQSR